MPSRNGSFRIEGHEDGLLVDFECGGVVNVTVIYLERKVSPDVIGGLQHAFAVATHAAQGEAYALAAPLLTDASSAEGVHVGITRGQFDLQGVAIRRRHLAHPIADDGPPVHLTS